MKKRIIKIISFVMTAALFTQGMPATAVEVDTPVDIDKCIYDQVVENERYADVNRDGVICEEEFKNYRLYVHLS